jgi:predicted RND superfamily exporter protein
MKHILKGTEAIASGLIVVFGFSALIVSPFPMTSSFGKITMLPVLFALFTTFTVFPVLMIGLDY